MITFSIEEEKRIKLSELLSELTKNLYQREEFEGLFINSYILRGSCCHMEKDGINISFNLIIDEKTEYEALKVYDEIREKIYVETGVNILFVLINKEKMIKRYFSEKYNPIDIAIANGTILFDKVGDLKERKSNSIFLDVKYGNSVEFDPPLILSKEL